MRNLEQVLHKPTGVAKSLQNTGIKKGSTLHDNYSDLRCTFKCGAFKPVFLHSFFDPKLKEGPHAVQDLRRNATLWVAIARRLHGEHTAKKAATQASKSVLAGSDLLDLRKQEKRKLASDGLREKALQALKQRKDKKAVVL